MSEIVSVDDLLALPDAEEIEREVVLPNGKTIIIRALSLGSIGKSRRTAQRRKGPWMRRGGRPSCFTMDQRAAPHIRSAEKLTRKPAGLVSSIVVSILELSGLTASGGISASVVERDEPFFAENDVLAAAYFLMDKFGIWDEISFSRRCTVRQIARWLAFWRYKAAIEEAELEKARLRHA